MATRRKRSEHYVNNKEFLAALEVYIAQVNRAKLNDKEPPQIPRYIGECFLKIANHLSYKPNFVNYMFKDDMICDGIENCVRYIHNLLCLLKKDITREKKVRNKEQNSREVQL